MSKLSEEQSISLLAIVKKEFGGTAEAGLLASLLEDSSTPAKRIIEVCNALPKMTFAECEAHIEIIYILKDVIANEEELVEEDLLADLEKEEESEEAVFEVPSEFIPEEAQEESTKESEEAPEESPEESEESSEEK